MMRDALNLTFEQIASIGAAIGAMMVGIYTAWCGYKAKQVAPASGAEIVPPKDVLDRLDRIENYVRHTEDKVEDLSATVGKVYTDTQVLRDRKG